MIAPISQNQMTNEEQSNLRAHLPTIAAVLLGLTLGGLLFFVWPTFSWLAATAVWPLGLGLGLLAVSLIGFRRGETLWGMALVGQFLAIAGVGMLFFATVL